MHKSHYKGNLSTSDDLLSFYFQMADSQCLSQEKKDLLIAKTPDLKKCVATSKYFWAVLAKHDVLTGNERERVQVCFNILNHHWFY